MKKTIRHKLLALADRFGGAVTYLPDCDGFRVDFPSPAAAAAWRRAAAPLIRRNEAQRRKLQAKVRRLKLKLVCLQLRVLGTRIVRVLRDLATGKS